MIEFCLLTWSFGARATLETGTDSKFNPLQIEVQSLSRVAKGRSLSDGRKKLLESMNKGDLGA